MCRPLKHFASKMVSNTISIVFAFVVTALAGLCSAQVLLEGNCPTVTTKPDFKIDRYTGGWYEDQRFYNGFEQNIKCNRANYTLNDDGSATVLNRGIDVRDRTLSSSKGRAMAPDDREPAKLIVDFSGQTDVPEWAKGNYWVLDTDYTSWAIVYACSQRKGPFGQNVHSESAWILSRQRNGLTEQQRDTVYKLLEGQGVNPLFFNDADQANCYYIKQALGELNP